MARRIFTSARRPASTRCSWSTTPASTATTGHGSPGGGSVINNKFNAPDGPICSDLREAGALLAASADFQHSYPHSWRSKAKVIYRCTPQWFIAMDQPLRQFSPETRAEQRWDNEGGRYLLPSLEGGAGGGCGAQLRFGHRALSGATHP